MNPLLVALLASCCASCQAFAGPLPAPSAGARKRVGSAKSATPPAASATATASADDWRSLPNPDGVDEAAFGDAYELWLRMQDESAEAGVGDGQIGGQVREALGVLSDAVRLYGPARLYASFNGGKDAVCVLHLLRAAVAAHCVRTRSPMARVRCVYFEGEREFDEIAAFARSAIETLDLDASIFTCGFVEGLEQVVAGAGPASLGFVLGTRRGDPNCGVQESFSPSSDWMPPFMRVNPVLTWEYGDVWRFLTKLDLDYCSLYDKGYTSLGNKDNTRPNPRLLRNKPGDGGGGGGGGGDEYHPAYMLEDWTMERAGRDDKNRIPTLECELKDLARERNRVRDAKTAAVLIVGDEILKGRTPDVNAHVATTQLSKRGISVQRMVCLPDDCDTIAAAVQAAAQEFDVVVTSGGVGPTHDDVTVRAVAQAFGQRMALNEELATVIRDKMDLPPSGELDEATTKMATVPELAELRTVQQDDWPILQCANVFILPGVPQFFEKKMETIAAHFLQNGEPMAVRKLVMAAEESTLVAPLNRAVKRFPGVTFGSYPFYDRTDARKEPRTVFTIEGADAGNVDTALTSLLAEIDPAIVVKVVRDDADLVSEGQGL